MSPQVRDPLWTADVVRCTPRMAQDLYRLGIGADIPVISQIPKTSVAYIVPLDHFVGTTVISTTPSVDLNMQSVGPSSTIFSRWPILQWSLTLRLYPPVT